MQNRPSTIDELCKYTEGKLLELPGFGEGQPFLAKLKRPSMLSLIRSQIVGKCETYMKQGFLPEYARYCLEELFKQYKALGGNHGVETLVNKCYELPLSIKEEK